MPAMTMSFKVPDAKSLQNFNRGDAVSFVLHIKQNRVWVSDLVQIADSLVPENQASNDLSGIKVDNKKKTIVAGDIVPDVELTNQDGQKFKLSIYRGKILVITFFYTNCPLPNYCPLMSKNFAAMQPVLFKKYGDKVQLLSISFDSKKDTPAILKDYSEKYTHNLKTWTFATGTIPVIQKITSDFGVFYSYGKDQITHNLRTAVIGTDGTLLKLFPGNNWTPDDVVQEIDRRLNK